MRFPSQAGMEDFKALIAAADDEGSHHVLSLAFDGQVHLTPVDRKVVPDVVWLQKNRESLYVFPPFARANDYVGPQAAANSAWMEDLYSGLVAEWEARGF